MSSATATAADANRLIWRVVAGIPPGQLMSYGEVARQAGLPGRARQVAPALRLAGKERNLPWHRVIRSGGDLGFPRGSHQWQEQVALLAAEGVHLSASGRVAGFKAKPATLDQTLWGPVDGK